MIARLILPDKGDLGIHSFLVPIRDLETHKPFPGVTAGDIGPKICKSTCHIENPLVNEGGCDLANAYEFPSLSVFVSMMQPLMAWTMASSW